MLRNAVDSLLGEPRVPDPPRRVRRDWWLFAVVVLLGVVEAVLTVEPSLLPLALIGGVAPMLTLLWRRTHPLVTTTIAFGAIAVVAVATFLGVDDSVFLYASLYAFLLPYAGFRWGSGGEAVAALAIMVTVQVIAESLSFTGVGDAVTGSVLYLFPAAIGASVRYRSSSRMREIEKVQLVERGLLARELHDTVAHHVTAIAVQAEAGLAGVEAGQGGAVESLEAIRLAATRAMGEMRTLVGILRHGEEAEFAPQPGLADLERLARTSGGHLPVHFKVADDLGVVSPSVGTAVFRIAQESITNAVRHSIRATRVSVSVSGDDEFIRVVVTDDGAPSRGGRGSAGYGLVGMAERVALIGGTLEAGPGPDGYWTVTATLPTTLVDR